jgi:hypothetical protein
MSISRKYGRTFHFPFSPGTTSDDRISHNYYEDLVKLKRYVTTEKLDGENSCLNSIGVFARSHSAVTRHPWSAHLKQKWNLIQSDLEANEIEIFGENLYACHSIEYTELENHFFVFGIRQRDMWLSWEEVEEWCYLLDFKTVPVFGIHNVTDFKDEEAFRNHILSIVDNPSTLGSIDFNSKEPCLMEGVVVKNADAYLSSDNGRINYTDVWKYVRKDHVKSDEHWSKNWQVAQLKSWK